MNRIEWPILSHSDPIQFSQVPPCIQPYEHPRTAPLGSAGGLGDYLLGADKFGAIQRHGGIRIGDLVVRVNDLDCALLAFNQVVGAVQNSNVVRKRSLPSPLLRSTARWPDVGTGPVAPRNKRSSPRNKRSFLAREKSCTPM